jgi:hypothetical protein
MAMTRNRGFGWLALLGAGLGASLLAVCGGSEQCVPSQCASGALLQIQLVPPPSGGTGPSITLVGLPGGTLTVCRNDECYFATLPDAPAPGGAEASLAFAGTELVAGSIWQNADQSIDMNVEWHLTPEQAVNGDHYVVTASRLPTSLLDKTASYSPTTPGPNECPGGPVCQIAVLVP